MSDEPSYIFELPDDQIDSAIELYSRVDQESAEAVQNALDDGRLNPDLTEDQVVLITEKLGKPYNIPGAHLIIQELHLKELLDIRG